jgi:S1-C subfamily serine protease
VVVPGYRLQGILAQSLNVTTGIVSALAGLRDDRWRLQISAPSQPGNSGGPVLDGAGQVFGVAVGKLNALRAAMVTGDIAQNVNFAIKGALAQSFLDINGVP